MALEKTLTGNQKVRLNPQYPVVAGADSNNVPRFLRLDEDGRLDCGVVIPAFDDFTVAYWTGTNNIKTVIYTLESNEVARWTFTYVGGGVADNDKLLRGSFTRP
jgi:hypothetical protein